MGLFHLSHWKPHMKERLKIWTQKADTVCFVVFKEVWKTWWLTSPSLFAEKKKKKKRSLFSILDQAWGVILSKSLVQNQLLSLPPAASLSVCFKGFCFCCCYCCFFSKQLCACEWQWISALRGPWTSWIKDAFGVWVVNIEMITFRVWPY